MANIPILLLADEPTGAVDTATTKKILDLFNEINRLTGVTVVIVTHDRLISRQVDRVVAIRDGRTSSEFVRKKSYSEELDEIKSSGISNGADKDEETHVELAVIDKAGRIQVPREYLDSLSLKGNKIKVEKEDGRIVLIPPEE
jgi:ABC-type methionine transport system ATPase subunit